MNKKAVYIAAAVLLIIQFTGILIFSVDLDKEDINQFDKEEIYVEFYFSQDCDACKEVYGNISDIEDYYADNITLLRLDYSDNKERFYEFGCKTTPCVIIRFEENFSRSVYGEISTENLKFLINKYMSNSTVNQTAVESKNVINTPFGKIDLSDMSLPILTVLLGAIDSVNPCSFFVLLFLLSLLLHTKSRKRMILIGSIFIFFSGFIYFLLMTAILNFFIFIQQQIIIAIIAGIVAIIFGSLNIKDFFFFDKGPSASIPKSKKPKLFKQMSKLVKITYLPSLLVGTIILAISANTVELLCSFNLPLIYTGILTSYNLSGFDFYLYLFFYNLVYVIPLLIIVSFVVLTFGRWKLSEFQGRVLKLFSGIMMFSLGEVLLININILENVFSTIGLVLLSLVNTVIILYMFKYFKIDESNKIKRQYEQKK